MTEIQFLLEELEEKIWEIESDLKENVGGICQSQRKLYAMGKLEAYKEVWRALGGDDDEIRDED